jgi:NAD-specific glutamate dehydrogenase
LRRALAFQLLSAKTTKKPGDIAAAWLAKNSEAVLQFKRMIDEMKLRDEVDFATLTVAAQQFRSLIAN